GRAPFHEDGLDELIAAGVSRGRLSGTADIESALNGADVSLIAVGTPSVDGRIDLRHVEAAACEIGKLLPKLDRYHVVILKSTCVPGTADTTMRSILERESGMTIGQFGLAM